MTLALIADYSLSSWPLTGMTVEEIVGQGFIILIAGYETTSTTLQYLTYNLTLNPDVQEKVFEEIRDKVGNVSHVPVISGHAREA